MLGGVRKSSNKEQKKYFSEQVVGELIQLPRENIEIGKILHMMISPEIVDIKWVQTPKGKNFEGKYLSGGKLNIQMKLSEKLIYSEGAIDQNIGSISYETIKSIQIIVPEYIERKEVSELVVLDRLNILPYVEDVGAIKVDETSIYRWGLIFVEAIV